MGRGGGGRGGGGEVVGGGGRGEVVGGGGGGRGGGGRWWGERWGRRQTEDVGTTREPQPPSLGVDSGVRRVKGVWGRGLGTTGRREGPLPCFPCSCGLWGAHDPSRGLWRTPVRTPSTRESRKVPSWFQVSSVQCTCVSVCGDPVGTRGHLVATWTFRQTDNINACRDNRGAFSSCARVERTTPLLP